MKCLSSCVAVYPISQGEEGDVIYAVKDLLNNNYLAHKLSVIGKGSSSVEHTIGIYKGSDQVRYIGEQSEFWHDMWELLSGEAFFLIPDFGSLAVAGELSSVMLIEGGDGQAVCESLADHFTELGRALYSVGIPAASIAHYESVLQTEQLILIVHGDNQEVEQASYLLELSQGMDVSLHLV